MKKVIFLLSFISSFFIIKGQDASKITGAKEIVWYGLDFTKAKFLGKSGSKPDIIKSKHIPSWNTLVVTEPQNFDLKKAVGGKDMYYDLNPVRELNNGIDYTTLESFNTYSLDRKEVDGMVSKYKQGDKKEGVGLAFIIEKFDKNEESVTAYVTFFDIASNKVLACKKLSGKVRGVGFRNYWAGAIKEIIDDMDTNYAKWQ